jgi:hypothetical protein
MFEVGGIPYNETDFKPVLIASFRIVANADSLI